MTKWILHSGNEYFFAYWTTVGPKIVQDIQQAQLFDTKEEALLESSKHWALLVYEPKEIELGTDKETKI